MYMRFVTPATEIEFKGNCKLLFANNTAMDNTLALPIHRFVSYIGNIRVNLDCKF